MVEDYAPLGMRWVTLLRGAGSEIASGGVALAAALAVARGELRAGFPVDDAWIHMVYGLALRNGEGLAYDTNVPATGCTSPLWAVVAAAAHVLAFAAEPSRTAALALKLLGVLSFVATAVLSARLARACAPRRAWGPAVALVAGAAVAASPVLAFAAASGMEVCLASALMLASLLAAVRVRSVLAGALAGVAVLARPEALVIVPVVTVLAALSPARRARVGAKGSGRLGRTMSAGVAAAVPIGALALRNWRVSGRPLPSTFYSKAHAFAPSAAVADLRLGFVDLLGRVPPTSFLPLWLLVGAALVMGVLSLAKGPRPARPVLWRRLNVAALALAGVVYVVGIALTTRLSSPEVFYFQRYALPAVALLVVSAVCAGAWIVDGLGRPAARARARPWLKLAALVTVLVGLGLEVSAWAGEHARYASDARDIDAVQVSVGRFLQRTLPPDAIVWSQDAGAIRYWGRRPTVDLAALNTPQVFHGSAVSPEWWPDTVVVAVGVLQVHAPPGLFDPIGQVRAPSNPDDPLGLQVVLRCRAAGAGDGEDRAFTITHGPDRMATGECARRGESR